MVLDFVKLCKSHTGCYLCDSLVSCLRDFGIENKILGVVCDNASNNNTLVSHLELELCGQNGTRTRIRCFAHILNLAVKAILTPFSKRTAVNEVDNNKDDFDVELYDIQDDEDDDEEVEEGREASDKADIESIADEVDLEIFVSASQFAVVKSALLKVSETIISHNSHR